MLVHKDGFLEEEPSSFDGEIKLDQFLGLISRSSDFRIVDAAILVSDVVMPLSRLFE